MSTIVHASNPPPPYLKTECVIMPNGFSKEVGGDLFKNYIHCRRLFEQNDNKSQLHLLSNYQKK